MRTSIRSVMAVGLALGLLALVPALAGDDAGKVVVTRPGVVFHKAGASDIRGHSVEKTIDSALEAGYTPCPICFAKEIAAARTGASGLPGAAATASGAIGALGIPAPPVSVVSQPFGLRYATDHVHAPKDAVRNPYDDLFTVVPGRSEQGAYGTR